MPPKGNARRNQATERQAPRQQEVRDDMYGDYDNGGGMDFENDNRDERPKEQTKPPPDQEKGIKEDEDLMNEMFTKTITAMNPNVSKALVRYQFRDSCFKPDPSAMDHLAVHFSMDGECLHVDSDEWKEQHMMTGGADMSRTALQVGESELKKDVPAQGGKVKTLKNQFNFTERACVTFTNPLRNREILTEPPPTAEMAGAVTQWDIFDTYLDDVNKQIIMKDIKDGKRHEGADLEEEEKKQIVVVKTTEEVFQGPKMAKALKIMERLVGQNDESAIFYDYKFWEHLNSPDTALVNSCSFLPLWRFSFDKVKQPRKTVTSVCWNRVYHDLFAVGYGTYEFQHASKQGPGLICCYSLKNTSFPEYSLTTQSGVICLDFHPTIPSLLVAGLYDGTVCVFDVKNKAAEPIFSSTDPKTKHTDPVWQVCWQQRSAAQVEKEQANAVDPIVPGQIEEKKGPLNFFSVSSDGRFTNWIVNKNDLINEEVIQLKLMPRKDADGESAKEQDDQNLVPLACGCCFDFNPSIDMIVIGTEEGAIQTYNTEYNSTFVMAYEGHHMAVYAVRWNHFNPGVFISCSADWTVKVWEYKSRLAVMTFDLNSSCGDVCWAPFKSTVFACVTADGWVRLFDLAVNKHEPIGEYISQVSSKNAKATGVKLTHLAFNPKEYVVAVGDERGIVTCLKLAQNLRKLSAKTLEEIDPLVEMKALNDLLIIQDERGHIITPVPIQPKLKMKPKKEEVKVEVKAKKKGEEEEGGD